MAKKEETPAVTTEETAPSATPESEVTEISVNVVTAFDFYHDGCHPTTYEEGVQAIPADAATVALAEGWAVEA